MYNLHVKVIDKSPPTQLLIKTFTELHNHNK